MKTAIVYYSMSGNTAITAEKLAEGTGADLIRIAPEKAYPDRGFRKFLWGGKSAVMAEKPPLRPYDFHAEDFDRVIIGFPVWFPLMVAFFAVLLSVYIVLWAVVGTLYVVEFAFGISAAACFVFGFGVLFGWIPIATTLVGWGLALVLGGLFLLLWHPICALAGALIRLIKATFRKIKGMFAKSRA